MHSKFSFIVFLIFAFGTSIVWSQEAVDSLPPKPVVKQEKAPLLLAKVNYKAIDCVRIDRKNNKLILFNQAELYYQDIELRAGIIVLDYDINEVYAGRIELDTAKGPEQYPYFKQAGNVVNPDSIRFN
ncbi:LPS-assembly protein LptD, partial [Flavobacteriaceae bacterium]|nr:LPS-assembly protein LptD [Flavobacteriaceae bacterium]